MFICKECDGIMIPDPSDFTNKKYWCPRCGHKAEDD